MFIRSRINLAKANIANIATDCAHDDGLPDPFFPSLLSGVVVGGFGRTTFVDSRTEENYFQMKIKYYTRLIHNHTLPRAVVGGHSKFLRSSRRTHRMNMHLLGSVL